MTTLTMLIGLATLGVDTGWQPVDGGVDGSALEYIIQIEPSLLDALRDGQPITSEIPAGLKGVRRYKIVVGKAQLPRTDLPAPPGSIPAGPAPSAQGSPGTVPPPTASPPTGSPPTGSLPAGSLPAGSPLAVAPPAAATAASPPDRYTLPFSQAGVPVVPRAAGAGGRPAAQSVSPNPSSPNRAMPGSSLPAEAQPRPSAQDEPTASASPRPFQPDVKTANLAGGSLVVPEANRSPDTPESGDRSETDHPVTDAGGEPPKPWLPLTMAMLVLFVSLSGNAFLGWAAWDARRHYRKLVRQTVGREPTGVVEFPEEDPLIVGDRISSIHT